MVNKKDELKVSPRKVMIVLQLLLVFNCVMFGMYLQKYLNWRKDHIKATVK